MLPLVLLQAGVLLHCVAASGRGALPTPPVNGVQAGFLPVLS